MGSASTGAWTTRRTAEARGWSFASIASSAPSSRPLESARWGGAVDSVGGVTLGNLLRQMAYGASVAACGNAGGADVPTTVYPFILRAVNLLGIDSLATPIPRREVAFRRLADDVPADVLSAMTTVEPLSALPELGAAIVEDVVVPLRVIGQEPHVRGRAFRATPCRRTSSRRSALRRPRRRAGRCSRCRRPDPSSCSDRSSDSCSGRCRR